jgi:RNA polymerase sigma factor (sigma-70 family)
VALQNRVNLVHDHYKHQRGSPVTESLDDVLEQNLDWGPSATEKVFRSQLLKIVYGILPGLTCRERSVFVLKTMEGLENDEVSRILQISQTTVRRFYGLARRKILEAVEQKMNLSGIHL